MDPSDVSTVLNQSAANVISAYQAKTSKDYADKNFDLQSDNFDYQKALQERIFAREDTALQRYMTDLKAAGLNPQLAAGSHGSNAGSVVSTTPPQRDAKWLDKLHFNLDYITSLEQIAQQKYQTEIMKQNAKKAKEDYIASSYNSSVAGDLAAQSLRDTELQQYAYKLYNGTITPEEFNKYSWYLTPILNEVTKGNAEADIKRKDRDTYSLRTVLDVIRSITSSYRGFRGWN